MDNKKFLKELLETMPHRDALLFLIKKDYGSVAKFKGVIKVSHQAVYDAISGKYPNVKEKMASKLGIDAW